jgi:hypothetical protein
LFLGVFIEKNAGQDDYEFYPNAGSATDIGTETLRGKVCWIDTAGSGLCRIGHNGSSVAGYTPAAGLKVVIGNIILQNCTSSVFTNNCIPNATLGTRYGFADSCSGVNMFTWVMSAWRMTFMYGYFYGFNYVAALDRLTVRSAAGDTNVIVGGVGQTLNYGFDWSGNFSISTSVGSIEVRECVFTSYNAVSGRYPASIDSNKSSVIYADSTAIYLTNRTSSETFAVKFTANHNGCSIIRPAVIGGGIYCSHNTGAIITAPAYADVVSGTTGASYGNRGIFIQGQRNKVDGFAVPINNTHPLTAVFWLADSFGADIRNIGSRLTPLNLGTVNKSQRFIAGSGGDSNTIQRCYHTPCLNNPINFTDSATNKLVVNNCHEIPPSTSNSPGLNSVFKGCGAIGVVVNNSNLGSLFFDTFTSDVTGRLQIVNSEQTAEGSYLLVGAKIPSRLYNVGDSVEWEWPYFIKGHSGFANINPSNLHTAMINYHYQLDTGSGFGPWTVLSGGNLSSESVNPSIGFRLKVRAVAFVANTSIQNSIDIYTITSLAAQEAGLYPLDMDVVDLYNVVTGSDIVILSAGTTTELANINATPTSTYSTAIDSSTYPTVDVCVYKQGYIPFTLRNISISGGKSLPINQVLDRNFSA